MLIYVPKEADHAETRVAMVPELAAKLVEAGAEVGVEPGLGEHLGFADADYEKAGVRLQSDRADALAAADMVFRVGKPPREEVGSLRKGCLHVSHLDPFNEKDLVQELAKAGVSAVSMEMMPRSTIAQKMDSLSSQASLAGYAAVLLAAERLDKILPMMSTPSGTIPPARVFIIGAGVAGLQAIATAKRLGALVEAFDTRAVVEEQVRSLGARFVKVDLGETGQTKDGYAKALTEEQLAKQREAMAKHCAQADIVITTAKLFGRPAPRIVTDDMLAGMAPGSVVVDMAVDTGGNVEGSKVGEEVLVHGVRVVGHANLPGKVPIPSSQMYAANLTNFVLHFWDKETKAFNLDREDEIITGSLVTHDGEICNETVKQALA
jgi:NAD(P) transhydrogenase subunit alpha